MKRTLKSFTGVTLLEILLVLAVAAVIILMSVRYYNQASTSQNANTMLEQVQNIAAAADTLSQPIGSYMAASGGAISNAVGANNLVTPYASSMAVTASTASTITITTGVVNTAACTLLIAKLTANNPKFIAGCANGIGTITYRPFS